MSDIYLTEVAAVKRQNTFMSATYGWMAAGLAISAVSADEKNADKPKSPITISICRACPESKKITPISNIIYFLYAFG